VSPPTNHQAGRCDASSPDARIRQNFAEIGVELPIGVPFNTRPRPRAEFYEVATMQGPSIVRVHHPAEEVAAPLFDSLNPDRCSRRGRDAFIRRGRR
jgi:hypothetical protein